MIGMDSSPSTGSHAPALPAWAAAALDNQPIDRQVALSILDGDGAFALLPLLEAAGQVRRAYHGLGVTIHILDNVQNGACPEDCGYCGQSKVSDAPIQPYKLKSVDEIVREAGEAKERGAWRFCMVMSGRGPDGRDIDHMCQAIRQVKSMGMRTCLSAGLMDDQQTQRLAQAGLDRLNHNLNTSAGHYPEICTTHTYADRLSTLQSAKAAGIGLCSGMIVGLGESHQDILEVAYALKAIEADSIPVNFLLPIQGNPLNRPISHGRPLTPEYVLRVLCMFRLVNPSAEIRIAAGREYHLRSMQPLALWPANSLFMDGYLLSEGQEARRTLDMIFDAGFTVKLDGQWPQAMQDYAAARADGRVFADEAESGVSGSLGASSGSASGCCGAGEQGNSAGAAGPTVDLENWSPAPVTLKPQVRKADPTFIASDSLRRRD